MERGSHYLPSLEARPGRKFSAFPGRQTQPSADSEDDSMSARGLFQTTALPLVVRDLHDRLGRASNNCVTAIRYLRRLASPEPLTRDPHKIVLALGTDVFRLSEEAFPTAGVRRFIAADQLEVLEPADRTQLFWAFFAYFYSLLPPLVERGEGLGRRWHQREIDQLRQHCQEAWQRAHEVPDCSLFEHYRSVDAACRRWWPRQREIVAAVDPAWLAVEIAPVAGAGLAPERFQPLMGDLLTLLLPAMRGEIEQFSLDSRRQGFVASDLNVGLTES